MAQSIKAKTSGEKARFVVQPFPLKLAWSEISFFITITS